MSNESLEDSGTVLEQLLGGAPRDIWRQMCEALLLYSSPSKGMQDDLARAGKLRGAYNSVRDWLFTEVVPDLNETQWTFLSTGLLGSQVVVEGPGGEQVKVDLVPRNISEAVAKSRVEGKARPEWAAPILDFEDRIHAIAKGELLGLDASQSRRRKVAKPIGSERHLEKMGAKLENLAGDLKSALGGLDGQISSFGALRDEAILKNLRTNLEAIRKFVAIASRPGERSAAEEKFVASVRERLPALARPIGDLGDQLMRLGRGFVESAESLEGKLLELRGQLSEIDKIKSGQASPFSAFDDDSIQAIRRDAETLSQFVVHASEVAEDKVSYSASRILVKEQWEGAEGEAQARFATVPAVVAAIEKIAKIHVNLFPKDQEGAFRIPPVIIEPIRNYVEFFDDRLVLGFVSGERPRKGPKVTLNPLEVQVLRGCGHYLSKDPIYDYHGDLNVGTFIGDYSGKLEKKTTVKWTGEEKKFTLASTSHMVDGASRAEAVADYMDCIFAFANGINPPQKLTRRKVAVILRYCVIENPEKTVALTLMHVAQAEPAEARETIMKHAKSEEKAKELVGNAFLDPQVAKVCGERDYFISRIFGR